MRFHRTSVHTSAVAVLIASTLSFAGPVVAETRDASVRSTGKLAVSRIHIDNFGKIDDTYYRGSQPDGSDYVDLASLGVKTVINLTSDDAKPSEPRLVEQAGMKYMHIPMTMHTPPTASQLAQFFEVVDDPVSQPVYVHCVGGKHRTGVMTAVYRMVNNGWSADQAFSEMKQYKFGLAFLHSEFKEFVFNYHPAAASAEQPNVLPVQ